ncbi:hypothetical protein [Parasporobacterium paucivorans]|uniref:Uncharacterized protein n=1 Tax=Parasporobacterium paucivorans DSM 15970 TaxID=1122934 RepID=A0A1M6E1D9_9FIRM|nr:hypothetical protein [Parasporobacterium paucivorans]SHI79296.1 hypothetical protein SAMN02745691_00828 [Parasporobacterium paucivorans DSM 15970]
MKKKLYIGIGSAIAVIAVLVGVILKTAGGSLDVVGEESAISFENVLNTIPGNVSQDEMNGGFSLKAPDGSVRFIWSEDYSSSPLHDVMLELDAKPFVDAGLDAGKLPENYSFYEGMLMVGTKYGEDALSYSGEPTPLAAYENIVKKYRSKIGFHTALDHFNVNIGDGNLFEWAKDFSTNSTTGENQDKDIVFVLNPEPLIAAGVDPEKVEGWVYAQVTVDINGKSTNVWKFLKLFNLK